MITDAPAFGRFGLAARDYFIAHAPAEPQPWFKPVMRSRPIAPTRPADFTPAERNEISGRGDYIDTEDMLEPRAKAYSAAMDVFEKALRVYNAELEKQRYVQWPAAWADAMLIARHS